MGFHFYYGISIQRGACLLISLLFVSTTTQQALLVQGRSRTTLGLLQGQGGADILQREGNQKIAVRAMIGSRPPTCDRRCITCGHCEAVQVPAVPQSKSGLRKLSTGITSRGDDSSNYKPMSWKCKCGGMIFNP